MDLCTLPYFAVQHLICNLRTSSLTTIDLENCSLLAYDLRTLLQASPSLKSFRYTSEHPDDDPLSPSPTTMVSLLEPFREALQSLALNLDVEEYMGATEDAEPDLIKSIAHFTTLEHFEIPTSMFATAGPVQPVAT
jgi:hypothetical protein